MQVAQSRLSEASHVAYADESYYMDDRFRSVAVVSMQYRFSNTLSLKLRCLLDQSSIGEFKWSNLRQARERFAATKIIREAVALATAHQLRIDVLIWDTEDSRHRIQGRDDIANLQRMYFHLFRNVLHRRWPKQSTWHLLPDENSALDWSTVKNRLDAAGTTTQSPCLFEPDPFRMRLVQDFRILQIEPTSSACSPLCQMADLFAGLGAYSHTAFPDYTKWLTNESGQLHLGTDSLDTPAFTNSQLQRFQIMRNLDQTCKSLRLRVSLDGARGFKTFDGRFPLNFWLYQPQHPGDKAPIKRAT